MKSINCYDFLKKVKVNKKDQEKLDVLTDFLMTFHLKSKEDITNMQEMMDKIRSTGIF